MATIKADYGVMSTGHDGLVVTWNRIETHLADLDRTVAATNDMKADVLTSYLALKAKWTTSAGDRQTALKALGDLIAQARDHYKNVDAMLATQFAV